MTYGTFTAVSQVCLSASCEPRRYDKRGDFTYRTPSVKFPSETVCSLGLTVSSTVDETLGRRHDDPVALFHGESCGGVRAEGRGQ